jgi:hypothetical protein
MLSLLRRVNAVDAIEHRAFARAIGADDGANFVFAHIKADVRQRFDTAKAE